MTITHFNQEIKLTPNSMMLLVKLNSLTDAELSEQYPNLNYLKRDEKIKFILSVQG
jgi:hypothetical protein